MSTRCGHCKLAMEGQIVRVNSDTCTGHWCHPECLSGQEDSSFYMCPTCNTTGTNLKGGKAWTLFVEDTAGEAYIMMPPQPEHQGQQTQQPAAAATPRAPRSRTCETCGKEFKDTSAKTRHMMKHNNVRFICPICDRSFAREEFARRHLANPLGHNVNPANYEIARVQGE